MGAYQWIAVIQSVLLLLASLLLFSVRAGFRSGRWTSDQETRLKELERRMERASAEMSKWATYSQGLIESARHIFVTRELAEERHREVMRRLDEKGNGRHE